MPKQTTEVRLPQHDREIAAIRKLILQGMKMLVATHKEGRATQRELRERGGGRSANRRPPSA